MAQVSKSMENGRRHDGQLRNHSLLQHHDPFHTSDVTAGRTFEADLDKLHEAVRQWTECCDGFTKAVNDNQMSAAVKDGTGPVAQVLGPRFNHRMGAASGVGYAVTAYRERLRELLDGLNATAANIARTEDQVAADLHGTATS